MGTTKDLIKARREKNDEFYTQLQDIENELRHYKKHFVGKTILCNCDDHMESNFYKYFALNFKRLGIKKLVTTHYNPSGSTYKLEMYNGEDGNIITAKTPLSGNGDFRSEECLEILKASDIVVTNPPFSLFIDYVRQIISNDKSFIIVGSLNAMTSVYMFDAILRNKVWLGYGFKGDAGFFINKHYTDYATASAHKAGCIRVPGVCWYTNLDIPKRHEDIILWNQYEEGKFKTYDNYPNAIEVGKVKDIPSGYSGIMGVPITFIKSYNPEQFEILGMEKSFTYDKKRCKIDNKTLYARIFIKAK